MMWRISTLSVLLLVGMIVSGCVSRGERTGQMPIDRSFTTDGFRWLDGGTVYIYVKARENQGKVEICAARMWTGGPASHEDLNSEVMDAAVIRIDGKGVIHGLGFANPIPLTDNVIGQPAACARSTVDWSPGYSRATVAVDIPNMKFID